MRVAAVQFKARRADPARPDVADVERSRQALRALAERAARGADLVVLPEMAATGYAFPDAEAVGAVAEPAEGPTFEALAPVAAAHGCWMICGLPERSGDRLFNSALVLDPGGRRAFTYRKTLLFDADRPWATPGDSGYRTFDTGRGRFTVGICMDLNDDRFVGWCAEQAPEVVALPTNWLEEGLSPWPWWALRMHGVRAALVAANTWGREGPMRFCGSSAVLAAGRPLALAPPEGDCILRATLPG